VDGKFADAVLGKLNDTSRYVVAVEGKGPKDPLGRPFGGRRMSDVDGIEKPTKKLPSPIDLESDALVGEVKKVHGKKRPLVAAGLKGLRDEHSRTIGPARKLAVEALKLEHQISDLANEAYGLTPEEIALMWQEFPRAACRSTEWSDWSRLTIIS
jgi:hypothetical protein